MIGRTFGDAYVPGAPRKYTSKAKNAQEAHEAIRPTDPGRLPKSVTRYLEPEQARLYELIWTRTVASQMESAQLERTTVDIAAKVGERVLDLRATGQVVVFDGFLKLYQEGRDDETDEDGGRLPPMKAGDPLEKREIRATQHFTEPPPRFTEASLVKRMEELGIGRPLPTLLCWPCCASANTCGSTKTPRAGGQGPHRDGLSGKFLPALCRIRLHRQP